MFKINRKPIFLFVIYSLILAACTSGRSPDAATSSPSSISTLVPGTFIPTQAQSITDIPTPTPADLPVSQATVVPANSYGSLVYDDGKDILNINLDTGEVKTLILRDELERLLPENKSAFSTTFGYEKPVDIELSPDLTRALITSCTSLDERYRCIFNYFTYMLETKSMARIPVPPDIHGVHWKWSLDNTKLAGAAWTYSNADYEITRFYSAASDGTGIKALVPVRNEYWQTEWHPGNNVILPLTLVSDFRSIYINEMKELGISVQGLLWNDRIECLAFSPDTTKAAFVIHREGPSRDQLFVSRSDFVDLVPTLEYEVDPRYTCKLAWSPDQAYVHVGYELKSDPADETVSDTNALPPAGRILQPESRNFVELPNDILFCNWASNGRFLYEKPGLPGSESEIGFHNVTDSSQTRLSDTARSMVQHCPIRWLEQDLPLDIPVGLKVPNACHPGDFRVDDEDPVYPSVPVQFGLTEASSSLDGDILTATMKLNTINNDLTAYLTPGVTDFLNGWDVLVDIDNDVATGDRLGSEYRLSVVIRAGNDGAPPALGSAILQYNPVKKTYSKAGTLQILLDPDTQTLTLTGAVPGISTVTRLVYLSRLFDTATNSVIGDRICN